MNKHTLRMAALIGCLSAYFVLPAYGAYQVSVNTKEAEKNPNSIELFKPVDETLLKKAQRLYNRGPQGIVRKELLRQKPEYVAGEVIVKLKGQGAKGIQALQGSPMLLKQERGLVNINTLPVNVKNLTERYGGARVKKLFRNKSQAGISINAEAALIGATSTKRTPNVYRIDFDNPNLDMEKISEEYRNIKEEVEYAHPNYKLHVQATPNDPRFAPLDAAIFKDRQWGLIIMQAESAWDLSTGDGAVIIAMPDTGVNYTLTDLIGNIWTNSSETPDGTDSDANGYIDDIQGYDFVNRDAEPIDDNGHGTAMAAIMGAVTDNALGIAGTIWNVKLMPLKAFDATGEGTIAAVAEAVSYAADNGADVINLSFKYKIGPLGTAEYDVLKDAINNAINSGCIVITSAGNSDNYIDGYLPASQKEVIRIGASDYDSTGYPGGVEERFNISNYGMYMDAVAPGVQISTLNFLNESDDKYALYGTSASSAFASGLAALMLSHDPTLTQEQVRWILRNTSDDIADPGWDRFTGFGRINMYNALNYVMVSPIPSPCKAFITSPDNFITYRDPGTVEVRGTASGDGFSSYKIEIGYGLAPTAWSPSLELFTAVENGILASINVRDLKDQNGINRDGNYTIRLVVKDASGSEFEDRVAVVLDNVYITSPENFYPTLADDGEILAVTGSTSNLPGFQYYKLSYGTAHLYGDGSAGFLRALRLHQDETITLENGGTQSVLDGSLGTFDVGAAFDTLFIERYTREFEAGYGYYGSYLVLKLTVVFDDRIEEADTVIHKLPVYRVGAIMPFYDSRGRDMTSSKGPDILLAEEGWPLSFAVNYDPGYNITAAQGSNPGPFDLTDPAIFTPGETAIFDWTPKETHGDEPGDRNDPLTGKRYYSIDFTADNGSEIVAQDEVPIYTLDDPWIEIWRGKTFYDFPYDSRFNPTEADLPPTGWYGFFPDGYKYAPEDIKGVSLYGRGKSRELPHSPFNLTKISAVVRVRNNEKRPLKNVVLRVNRVDLYELIYDEAGNPIAWGDQILPYETNADGTPKIDAAGNLIPNERYLCKWSGIGWRWNESEGRYKPKNAPRINSDSWPFFELGDLPAATGYETVDVVIDAAGNTEPHNLRVGGFVIDNNRNKDIRFQLTIPKGTGFVFNFSVHGEFEGEEFSGSLYIPTGPALDSIGSRKVDIDKTVGFTVTAQDPDPSDLLTYSALDVPAGAAFDNLAQRFSWTPSSGDLNPDGTPKDYVVHFEVKDLTNLTDSEDVNIKVLPPNNIPALEVYHVYWANGGNNLELLPDNGNVNVEEGVLTTIKLKAHDQDVDMGYGDMITFSYSSPDLAGKILNFDSEKGTLKFSPASIIAPVIYHLTFKVEDDRGGVDTQDITITAIPDYSTPVGEAFTPASGTSVAGDTTISITINHHQFGMNQSVLLYRKMGTSDPLTPLTLQSTEQVDSGRARYHFLFPAGTLDEGEYDFELWIKDGAGHGWWSGWGGGWVLYSLKVDHSPPIIYFDTMNPPKGTITGLALDEVDLFVSWDQTDSGGTGIRKVSWFTRLAGSTNEPIFVDEAVFDDPSYGEGTQYMLFEPAFFDDSGTYEFKAEIEDFAGNRFESQWGDYMLNVDNNY